jgi:dipeptide/tripeptide permease
MSNGGGTLGVIVLSYIQDRFGRKVGFATAALTMLFGAGLAAGARNLPM